MAFEKPVFTIYPAIDLRNGQVVRLSQGDPDRQTIYAPKPATVARLWLDSGAPWLHVVNLDGAFGERDQNNRRAIEAILAVASEYRAKVQLGGGLRSYQAVKEALQTGVSRAILGTLTVEEPRVLSECLERFGPERIAASLDARGGQAQVRGWKESSTTTALSLAARLAELGMRWLIFTDVSRDGLGQGLNLEATKEIAQASRLNVIASGGVNSTADLQAAYEAGLAGVITGRALYEKKLAISRWRLD